VVFVFISTSRAIFVSIIPLQTCKFVVRTPCFCIILIFFLRKPLLFQRFYLPLPPKSLPAWGWEHKNLHRWNETSGHLYGQSRKDVFERYCLWLTNLANLNLGTEVMQQKAFTWVDFISPYGYHFPFLYILIRCMPID
jgi:hypothetical protein